jgi:hypothetical protein
MRMATKKNQMPYSACEVGPNVSNWFREWHIGTTVFLNKGFACFLRGSFLLRHPHHF